MAAAKSKATEAAMGGIVLKDKLIPALVVLLVVASFVIGMLYGKVSVYERLGTGNLAQNGGGTGNNQPTQPTQPNAPEAPVQLPDDQWKQIVDGAVAYKGNQKAKVTIVEFTDYQCPFCSRYFNDAYKQIISKYVDTGKVRYVARDLPLSFHPNAKPAALAARCAGDQKKYWEMHDLLFQKQTEWSDISDPQAKFVEYAGTLGLNGNTFTSCFSSDKFGAAIDADTDLASTVGAGGTPTFYINGKQLVGAQPFSAFEAAIEAAL